MHRSLRQSRQLLFLSRSAVVGAVQSSFRSSVSPCFFFFQAEDGIRDSSVTGVQTCALPISTSRHIGCRWGYATLVYQPESPMFHLAKATGLTVADWQDVIFVNQAGRRFWNEADRSYKFFPAAMAYNGDSSTLNGAGPIWATFDAAGGPPDNWTPQPPNISPPATSPTP